MFDFNAYGGRDYGCESKPALSTTTAKATKRALRVWLENKALLNGAGFHAGATYTAAYSTNQIALMVDPDGTGKVSSCKRGDALRPIIDLHSVKVAQSFKAGDALTVTYEPGYIFIRKA